MIGGRGASRNREYGNGAWTVVNGQSAFERDVTGP
jgi:hypothetical protein